jgi:xanthine dehydrogenase/oxidase
MPRTNLQFILNGNEVILDSCDPSQTLLEFLRSRGLTGTKLGCGEGGCGACTVTITSYDPITRSIKNKGINACLMPLVGCDSTVVTTVEGIGSMKSKDGTGVSSESNMHIIQQRMVDYHGSQCGYCTPGIVMAMYR